MQINTGILTYKYIHTYMYIHIYRNLYIEIYNIYAHIYIYLLT